jgi:hypothetical protein
VDLLRHIEEWIEAQHGTKQEKLFWLHGKAGAGKSTIANTVAAMVQQQGYLLSCFFCKRDDSYLFNPKKVLPALAFRFAEQHDSYRIALMKFFRKGTEGVGIAKTTDIATQLERLFIKLLPSTTDPFRPHVVVIDGLDECGSLKERQELVQAVLQLSSMTSWIKVFLTSRSEAEIRKAISGASSQCVVREINAQNEVDQDIELYISSQSKDLDIELDRDQTRTLVRRAEGLFIWCSTLFKYLDKKADRQVALNDILHGNPQQDSVTPLHVLYGQVLASATEDLQDAATMRAMLAVISLASVSRPLSITAIWIFLKSSKNCQPKPRTKIQVETLIARLHAVLYSEEAEDGGVRAYHTSFYDFLNEEIRPSADWLDADDIHLQMLRLCLPIMRNDLRFNICELDTPVLNKDVADLEDRIQDKISEELRYSSRFWFRHLLPSHSAEEDVRLNVLDLLGTERVLFWLECLSLQGSVGLGILGLERASQVFEVRYVSQPVDFHFAYTDNRISPRLPTTSRGLSLHSVKR